MCVDRAISEPTPHAKVWIFAVPIVGGLCAVLVLVLCLKLFIGTEWLIPENIIMLFFAVCLWITAASLFISPYQGMAIIGLCLFVIVMLGHTKAEWRWNCWVVTVVFIALFWVLLSYSSSIPLMRTSGSDTTDACTGYFDGHFTYDNRVFNTIMHNPQVTSWGICNRHWLAACSFFIAFQFIVAFLNLGVLSFKLLGGNLVPKHAEEQTEEQGSESGAYPPDQVDETRAIDKDGKVLDDAQA